MVYLLGNKNGEVYLVSLSVLFIKLILIILLSKFQ